MGHSSRCPDTRAALGEYVEGELSQLDSRRIEGHLSLCAACRREEARFRAAIGALRTPREPAPHQDLYAGFSAKLARYERRPTIRQSQLRWAAACGLAIVVMGGASAAYIHTFLTVAKPTVVAVVNPAPTGPIIARHEAVPKPAQTTPAPEDKFEWKNENSASPVKVTAPDPFDPKRIARDSSEQRNPAHMEERPDERRFPERGTGRGNAVARSGGDDFWRVKPMHGPSAEEIVVQKRHEVTVAQYGAPQPTEEIAQPRDGSAKGVQPFVIATDPDSKAPAATAGSNKPVMMAPVDDTEVMVNGRRTDVQSSVGYDKHGRAVLVKVNIGAKPARDKVAPDRQRP